MSLENWIGRLALNVSAFLILILVLFLLFAAVLTCWGIWQVTHNPEISKESIEIQYQEAERIINENQSRIINAVPAGQGGS